MAPSKTSYLETLKQEFSDLITETELSELQKRFLKGRWLDQLLWLEKRSIQSQTFYYRLRLLTIIGSVIIPALASLSLRETGRAVVGRLTFFLSQTVAISAAIEEFFGYGERYRNYRQTAEQMKTEGWQFLQLSGNYRDFQSHQEAYTSFSSRVESILQQEIKGYIASIADREQALQEQQKQKQNSLESASVVDQGKFNQSLKES
ncbi:MAG: DUF4231 domain-containing protein [Cyanobacteria bacterium]|jgi:hypothetical protein|nr:DUF4231 domain-containing protein [Cyanobacteria bacterium GSL.Bin21]